MTGGNMLVGQDEDGGYGDVDRPDDDDQVSQPTNPLATGRGMTYLTWQRANLLEVRRVVRVGIDQHLAM